MFFATLALCNVVQDYAPLPAPLEQVSESLVASKARARPRRGARSRYRSARRKWHKRPEKALVKAWMDMPVRPLVLRKVGSRNEFHIFPDRDGHFGKDATDLAALALAPEMDTAVPTIHPRLIALLYRVQKRFQAPHIYLISGVRDKGRASPGSRHRYGRAADIAVPGVRDRRLARYLRGMGFVGVGIYPTSGFVHIDVRARSYFWIDNSGPGQRSRHRSILRDAALKLDREARARGVEPPIPLPDPEYVHYPGFVIDTTEL